MAKDITVVLKDELGTVASMGEALGNAGISIEGIGGFVAAGEGICHILVEDPVGARSAIEDAGHQVRDERDVLVVDVEDKPGEVGRVTRKLADAGINVDLVYATNKAQLVIGVDDIDKARAAI